MKFSIQKNKLQKLLNEHSKVVPIRTTLPVLSCAEFSIQKNELKIKTTDLDQTIISQTTILDEKEGSVAIPMAKLVDIIGALPNEEIAKAKRLRILMCGALSPTHRKEF